MSPVQSRHTYLLCFALLAAAWPVALQAQAQKYEGKKILNIRFDPPPPGQPLEAEELFQILPLKKDEPLRMDVVRASIERLFASGRYSISKWTRSPLTMA